ncbi:hypothetical protein PTTG_08866 [Puccinia triticina 1-1 BBBD Race 1]|uniref:Uncharacterized protein n=1 Tax=Puccinia triticina (isolate 1-1 / race 1 (BBBD)) TaxID=630390 RepID=A0A0C4F6U2_PUCT1|nr:hypothetical protein PTTG_08866 [Puccinia triticina 1-1 BBBD Race 1]
MVNKLRNEGAQEDTEEQTLNHDTDGSMSAKTETEENEGSLVGESRYQYNKGLILGANPPKDIIIITITIKIRAMCNRPGRYGKHVSKLPDIFLALVVLLDQVLKMTTSSSTQIAALDDPPIR